MSILFTMLAAHSMRNRLSLIMVSLGGLTLSFLIFATPVYASSATSTAPCQKDFECFVPAPTIIQPTPGIRFAYGDRIIITGLSWNQTKVDIYIDGTYNGRADLHTDPSEVGNFVYRPFLPLVSGAHTLYTVARNLSELERSPQSPTINFFVSQTYRPVPAQATSTPEALPQELVTQGTTTNPSADSVLGWFFGQGNTTTASSTKVVTAVRGRTIVALIILALIIFFAFRVFRSRQIQMGAKESDTEGPTPPSSAPPPA